MKFLDYCKQQGIDRGSREYFLLKYLWHDLLREIHGYVQIGVRRKEIDARITAMRSSAFLDDREAERKAFELPMKFSSHNVEDTYEVGCNPTELSNPACSTPNVFMISKTATTFYFRTG